LEKVKIMPTFDYAARQAKIRAIPGVDAVAIVPGPNMIYFAGLDFHLSKRPLILLFTPDGRTSVIVPRLELPRLEARPDLNLQYFAWTDTDGYHGAFKQAVETLDLKCKTLGVDGMTMRVTEWLAFQSIDPSLQVKAIEKEIVRIRAIKSAEEITLMRQATNISERALDNLLAWVQPGMSEKAIAEQLLIELKDLGSTGLAFDPLVQTGPNSALPHGELTDRSLQRDEFLLIDYGGAVNGYPADITRTFCLGTPSGEMQKIYDTVLAANEAAKAAARPGVAMEAVDKAARDVITAAGYGEYFIHRTGHGLGLDTHEPIPQIAEGVKDILEPGMVFTIEPGIYIPNLGGTRIEDNVVVTEHGIDVLTSYPRKLVLQL
jgi:Xaa-Pro dipeptidase